MSRSLRWTLGVIDAAMLLYWGVAVLAVLGVVALPRATMYAGYGTPVIDAWNWSFAPVDVAFAVMGLLAVRAARRDNPRWRGLALVSLTLTGCAGAMAIAFWALRGEFDPAWWVPNLVLVAVALVFVPRLLR